jgi:raffinose/stachyose/melibiose transport system substrate-binding protein
VNRLLAASLVGLVLTACGGGGSGGTRSAPMPPRPSTAAGTGTVAAAAPTTADVASLGAVTLNVWSYDNQSPGLGDVLTQLGNRFMAKYPNVRVNIRFSDYDTLIQTADRVLASRSAPDVVEGSQGYRVDSGLVRAGLIRPLDGYAAAYGWNRWWGPAVWSSVRFADGGKTFGSGPAWGVGQAGQSVALFYNRKKLSALGYDPNAMPTTFEAFDGLLASLRTVVPPDQPLIELGNLDGYGAIHLFGALQGSYGNASASRAWVTHEPGATFETDQNKAALDRLRAWVVAGYINRDYAGVGYDQAALRFAGGTGVFYVGGTWEAPAIEAHLGADAGVMNLPARAGGLPASVGAMSGPYHIATRSRHPDLAAAWLDYMVGSQDAFDLLHRDHLTPAAVTAPPPDDPLDAGTALAWRQLDAAGGVVPYPTWASFSMSTTLSRALGELMAGKVDTARVMKTVQGDWREFDDELAAG